MSNDVQQVAKGLSKSMITVFASGGAGSGSARCIGHTNTIVALMDRGLIAVDHRWTALGRRVAEVVLDGLGIELDTIDDLHAEALAEAARRDGDTHPDEYVRFACGEPLTYEIDVEAARTEALAENAARRDVRSIGAARTRDAERPTEIEPLLASQIREWLARHELALTGTSAAECERLAREYHAAIDADHADALTEHGYREALRVELAKFAAGEAPYAYVRVNDGEPSTYVLDVDTAHAEALAANSQRFVDIPRCMQLRAWEREYPHASTAQQIEYDHAEALELERVASGLRERLERRCDSSSAITGIAHGGAVRPYRAGSGLLRVACDAHVNAARDRGVRLFVVDVESDHAEALAVERCDVTGTGHGGAASLYRSVGVDMPGRGVVVCDWHASEIYGLVPVSVAADERDAHAEYERRAAEQGARPNVAMVRPDHIWFRVGNRVVAALPGDPDSARMWVIRSLYRLPSGEQRAELRQPGRAQTMTVSTDDMRHTYTPMPSRAGLPSDGVRKALRHLRDDVLAGWVRGCLENDEALGRRDRNDDPDAVVFHPADIRRMVADTAAELGVELDDRGPQFQPGDRVYPRSGGQVDTVKRVAEIAGSGGRQQIWLSRGAGIARHADEYRREL